MPYLRIWRYRVAPGREADFARAYGPDGDWAQLFRATDGYLGTTLLRAAAPANGYLTVDRWRTAADWQRFLADHGEAYRTLDQRLAPLCVEDIELGSYESR